MTIAEITSVLESFAPLALQESYDNAGFIIGNKNNIVTGTLLCLDCTEKVLDEAITHGCNLIIAHHPIVFAGFKKITGASYVERVVIKAIKHDVTIYAAHTNLDNIYEGVNSIIAEKLGLKNPSILVPKTNILNKLYTYAPPEFAQAILQALYDAGAGVVSDYEHCSFITQGTGSFRGKDGSTPFIGKTGEDTSVQEQKIEVVFAAYLQQKVLQALHESHPYEEVAYEIITLANSHQKVGSGLIGDFTHPVVEDYFLEMVKEKFNTGCIRHTALVGRPIKRVAVCGGSGSFLLKQAIACGADAFITADYKYHEFFDADGRLLLMDIGHYESEQFTPELIARIIKKKIPKFAPLISTVNTNPVNYY